MLWVRGVSAKSLNSLVRPSNLSAFALLTFAGVVASGCNAHDLKGVEIEGSSVSTNSLPLDVNRKVDVLLVLDNSGSMGEEQANLAANFGPVIERLEEVGADYRIGITTTDIGGHSCEGQATGGSLHLSSCLDRPGTFTFNGNDQFAAACEAHCQLSGEELEIRPTEGCGDSEEAARPWIQSYNGVSNLPEGVTTLDAFQCFAPQGISGCGWESPLEAMARALENMHNPDRPEYGFLRDDALLAVVVVTDEVDCSYNPEHADALFLDGAFFADGVSYATSAACWNAGTDCEGESPYASCSDASYDASGNPTEDRDAAVLRPVDHYVELLEGVAAQKTSGREVLVSVIAGVPLGYQDGEAIVYADSPDNSTQELFGIGDGCSNVVNGEVQTAVPPVRLVSFASAFPSAFKDELNLYSVCSEDYTPALEDIVANITVELPPACYGDCVKDIDASTEELDYNCNVYQDTSSGSEQLPECERDGMGGHELPAGADACWIAHTGDDLDPQCQVEGQNLEFELVRRSGVEVPCDAVVSAACELSTLDAEACQW
ncbi:putative lipoprotein [Plesiocystis pacifica SIR-1]|uniref:Putative lipoprotein n=1 Tax=Plesiocystis pacifica SIR-1 TaxID=391625 RepID=A6G2C6_9BACT|nr:putative lipoprotein [Plesiocystis pacifica SIR-1]